jgi:primosomal protein N'
MECAMCGAAMIYHKYEFLRCPDCGSQFWPFVDGGTVKDMVREEFEKNLPCTRNSLTSKGAMNVKSKNMGGSKSKSAKKQPSKKKSTAQLYQDLSGQPNKIKLRKIE